MARDSSSRTRRRPARSAHPAVVEPPSLFTRYRWRRIDAVIDYFGEYRDAHAADREPGSQEQAGHRESKVLFTDGPFAETKA